MTAHRIIAFLSCIVLSFFAVQCSTAKKGPAWMQSAPRTAAKGLSQIEAEKRKSILSDVRYDLSVNLNSTDAAFSGTVRIDFNLTRNDIPLTIDFVDGTVDAVEVNGKLTTTTYNSFFITLPVSGLQLGANTATIRYHHKYNTTGFGLHRFKDPVDGGTYLYTQFEAYDANQLFPCFDQPDLKATYKLTAQAPNDWTIVSSRRENKVLKSSDGKTSIWTFGESKKFSTYLFSLHAGPYKVWNSQAGQIPLRLFARRSMAKYIPVADWFRSTKQGLKFYQDYFAVPYPFEKYDQLAVPDFNHGAMENVGAVTFSERFIVRAKPTYNQRESLSSVILHEMAHMWFGDLVTMKWWNALWLNESFATYMASLAQFEATEFKTSWQTFFGRQKTGAYHEDQLVTTHPIDVEIHNTEEAFAHFDGITYGKGASVLEQLSFYIGDDVFREGVRLYQKNYAFSNARLEDFFGSIEKASGSDLKPWIEIWLRKAGLNTVEAKYECEAGKVTAFSLIQGAPKDFDYLRPHVMMVKLFDDQGASTSVRVPYNGAVTPVAEFIGKPCPSFVYLNDKNRDYVKTLYHFKTADAVRRVLKLPLETAERAPLWLAAWSEVQDAELPATDFANLLATDLVKERDLKTLQIILSVSQGRLYQYLPWGDESGAKASLKYITSIEDAFWMSLKSAEHGSDFQKLWFDHYLYAARTPKALAHLKDLLQGREKLAGMKIDQDRRWEVLLRLNAYGVEGAQSLTQTEAKKDPTDSGAKMALACETARPDPEAKKQWLEIAIQNPKGLPLSKLKQIMNSLFPRNQMALRERFTEGFFKNLQELAPKKDNQYLRTFTAALAPALCTLKSAEELKSFANHHSELPPSVLRELKIAAQEDDRCVRIRTQMGATTTAVP